MAVMRVSRKEVFLLFDGFFVAAGSIPQILSQEIMSRWIKIKQLKTILAFSLMLVGVICLVWEVWPLPQKSQVLTLASPAADMMDEAQRQAVGGVQSWRITAETPLFMRIGDPASVRLTVEALPAVGLAGAAAQYNLEAEARCDLAGIQHSPSGNIHTALQPGHTLHFDWLVTASQPGSAAGVVWFYLDFVPAPGSQAKVLSSLPLSAQEFTLHSISLAGLNVSQARLLGVSVIFIGSSLLLLK